DSSGGAFNPSLNCIVTGAWAVNNIPAALFAGNTTGTATAALSQVGITGRTFVGVVTLTAGSASVAGLTPPFTGTDTASCWGVYGANVATNTAAPVVYLTSTSKVLIGGTGTNKVNWGCTGY